MNGNGRTLIVKKDVAGEYVYADEPSTLHRFDESDVYKQLNKTYKSKLDEDIIQLIGSTKFRDTALSEETGSIYETIYDASIFLLTEKNMTAGYAETLSSSVLKELTFLFSSKEEAVVVYWLSTISDNTYATCVTKFGSVQERKMTSSAFYRPCFTLPADYIPY